MTAVVTVNGDSFTAGEPRPWFPGIFIPAGRPDFDLTPDGKRIIAAMPTSAGDREVVTFLLNFADELRRKVPSK
jgi:hypothetical protein